MKKLKYLLVAFTALALVFTSCEGPEGPPGPPGFNGNNAETTQIFERQVTLSQQTDFSGIILYPSTVNVLARDVVLAYRLNRTDAAAGDIWELLPATYFDNGNVFTYNFNFSTQDVEIFLDAPINETLDGLNNEFSGLQTIRIAVIPTEDRTQDSKLLIDKSYESISQGAKLIDIKE